MPSPILARADALMRRQQQPNENRSDEIPVLIDALDGDDIPLLLDIAELPPTPQAIHEEAETPAPENLPEPTAEPHYQAPVDEALITALCQRVEQRIASELPRLIEATLRDYLAEQAMIRQHPDHD